MSDNVILPWKKSFDKKAVHISLKKKMSQIVR